LAREHTCLMWICPGVHKLMCNYFDIPSRCWFWRGCSYHGTISHYLLQVKHWTFMRYLRKQMEISTD